MLKVDQWVSFYIDKEELDKYFNEFHKEEDDIKNNLFNVYWRAMLEFTWWMLYHWTENDKRFKDIDPIKIEELINESMEDLSRSL